MDEVVKTKRAKNTEMMISQSSAVRSGMPGDVEVGLFGIQGVQAGRLV